MNWWARPSEWNRALPIAAAPALTRGPHRYFAFLSYSHADAPTAAWLHSALERFRVPPALAGRENEQGIVPERLTPIFRDRQELVAAHDLGAEIKQALASSKFLIVLCSPAAAASTWTNAEIDAFKRVRPDGCVIAAIVAGEPFASNMPGHEAMECFPPALRVHYDKRGRPTRKRAEPLAADLRESGDGKRLGLLKIVAAMLGVGLDELVQRETLRRQRRLAFITGGSLVGMLVTTSLAVAAVSARDEARAQRREAESLVGFMLGDLKDKLEPLGRLDVLDSVGTRALDYYRRQDKGRLSDEALTQRSKALTLIGEIANTRGDLDGALKRYREAFAGTAEAVRRYPDHPQRLFEHAQNVYWIGYIAYQRGQSPEASRQFETYKKLADRMVALAPGSSSYRLEQVYAETNLGTVLYDQRKYADAAQAFDGALRASEAVASADPKNLDHQKQLSEALGWLADAKERSGSLDQALAARERQQQLLALLTSQHAGDAELTRGAMANHRALARLLAARGSPQQALVEARRSTALADTLFAIEPENTEWLQANVASRLDRADIELALGQTADAGGTIRAACEMVDRLVSQDRTVVEWAGAQRVRCLIRKARVSLAQNAPAEALIEARAALAATNSSSKSLEGRVVRMQALRAGSDALAAAGNRDEAVRWAEVALQALPDRSRLAPRELFEAASLEVRLGNSASAAKLAAQLDQMGFRSPEYLKLRSVIRTTVKGA